MEEERYYTELAAAFVRGRLGIEDASLSDEALLEEGKRAELKLHKFKRAIELPRVRKVLGMLRAVTPANLLDVGTGRGVFLWPLLDSFPHLPVVCIDLLPLRASDIQAVRRGGVTRLSALRMDASRMAFADKSFDVVTLLEVIEHIENPQRVFEEAIRVARRFVIVSVPSHEDDNPEHIHLFTKQTLEDLLKKAGARKVSVEPVLNHLIAMAVL